MPLKRFFSSHLLLIIATIILVIVLFFLYPYSLKTAENQNDSFFSRRNDTLKVLLNFHASDYFIYKGTPIGFQYDLLKELGKALGKPVDISVCSDFDSIYKEVFKNNFDIIALDFRRWGMVTPLLALSYPHSFTYPVIIGRKDLPFNQDTIKNLYVPTYYHHFMTMNLIEEKNFKLVYQKEYNSEELFDLLQDKEIDYMVCDYNLAVTLLPFIAH